MVSDCAVALAIMILVHLFVLLVASPWNRVESRQAFVAFIGGYGLSVLCKGQSGLTRLRNLPLQPGMN